MWHRALSPKDGWDPLGGTPLTGREPSLVAWYPFNDASQAATSAPSASAAAAPAAVLYAPTAAAATYIRSAVPSPNPAAVLTSTSATPLKLVCTVPVGVEGSSVKTVVVTLPARGDLFQSDGVTRITHANTALNDTSGVVMYRPRPAAAATAATAASTDVIGYACVHDGVISPPALARVAISPVGRVPALLAHSRSAVCAQGGAVQVNSKPQASCPAECSIPNPKLLTLNPKP